MLTFRAANLCPLADCLNRSDPVDSLYHAALSRTSSSGTGARPEGFFFITWDSLVYLRSVTRRLHRYFLLGVDYVLESDQRLSLFGLDPHLWPLLRLSWQCNRHISLIGRFDFCWSPGGLKLFEYNADTAGCLYESSLLQEKWSLASRLEGLCAGAQILPKIMTHWRKLFPAYDLVHIACDHDVEELWTAALIKSVLARTGRSCKVIVGVEEFLSCSSSIYLDNSGDKVEVVWKTWSWDTVSAGFLSDRSIFSCMLLDPRIQVIEPFWKILLANKAMLPILWELFPGDPCLLPATHSLDAASAWPGFVAKPINGRCGRDVELSPSVSNLHRGASARDGSPNVGLIYQSYHPLPLYDGFHIQLSSFCVGSRYAGSGVRLSSNSVLNGEAGFVPLRILTHV